MGCPISGTNKCPHCGYKTDDNSLIKCPRCNGLLITRCSECDGCSLYSIFKKES